MRDGESGGLVATDMPALMRAREKQSSVFWKELRNFGGVAFLDLKDKTATLSSCLQD